MLSITRRIFPYFWWFLAMTFSGIHKFVLDGWLVLFLVDNFRVHRFLHKKTSRKSWFWNFHRRDGCGGLWASKRIPLWSLSVWRFSVFTLFSEILNFSCFQDIKWNYTQKAVNFQFSWFLAVIFGIAGVRFSNGITLKSVFFQNRIIF